MSTGANLVLKCELPLWDTSVWLEESTAFFCIFAKDAKEKKKTFVKSSVMIIWYVAFLAIKVILDSKKLLSSASFLLSKCWLYHWNWQEEEEADDLSARKDTNYWKNEESLCWMYEGPKEQFEALSHLWGRKSWNDLWNYCWAADYRSHTKDDNSKTLGYWNHSYLIDKVSIQQKKTSHFWGEGEEKGWKDAHSQPFVLDILKNKEKRGMVDRKCNLPTGTKCSISTDWFIQCRYFMGNFNAEF